MGLESSWYNGARWPLLLSPLEKLFIWLAKQRKDKQLSAQWRPTVPLIVVGNISVGGTGKSPLIIHLIERLQAAGFRPGVVSRGYGAKPASFPYRVQVESSAEAAGDEPLMIVRRTAVPMVIDPDRVAACLYLLANTDCNVILSDDGLQHYAMGRDIEIAVIDAQRGLGNGHCLPVGPLREPENRLQSVDYVLANGKGFDDKTQCYASCVGSCVKTYGMHLEPANLVAINNLASESGSADLKQKQNPTLLQGQKVHALAGIGNPQRFFNTLKALGYVVIEHSFKDHHRFTSDDLVFTDGYPVIMTEKDAVKCAHLDVAVDMYYLEVKVDLDLTFENALLQKLQQLQAEKLELQQIQSL